MAESAVAAENYVAANAFAVDAVAAYTGAAFAVAIGAGTMPRLRVLLPREMLMCMQMLPVLCCGGNHLSITLQFYSLSVYVHAE